MMGIRRFDFVIGGLHLLGAPEWALEQAADTLRAFNVQRIYPCHCTGAAALEFLKTAFEDRVRPLGTGSVVSW
ncbi:MAG: hypothetical protein ABIL58_09995 [Pseudomonadota bacterium]